MAHAPPHSLYSLGVAGRAHQDDAHPVPLHKPIGHGSETVCLPALAQQGHPRVGCPTGMDGYPGAGSLQQSRQQAQPSSSVGKKRRRGSADRHAQGAHAVQVELGLVLGVRPVHRHTYGMGEASPAAIQPGTPGNTGQPGQQAQRRGAIENDGQIEAAAPQRAGQGQVLAHPEAPAPHRAAVNDLVNMGVVGQSAP